MRKVAEVGLPHVSLKPWSQTLSTYQHVNLAGWHGLRSEQRRNRTI